MVEQGAPIEGPGAPKLSATTASNRNTSSETVSHAGMIEIKVYFAVILMPPNLRGKMQMWRFKRLRLQLQLP